MIDTVFESRHLALVDIHQLSDLGLCLACRFAQRAKVEGLDLGLRPWVVNASPLICLDKIRHVHLLSRLASSKNVRSRK